MEAKVRYKAYKAGKRWLYSAILFGSTVLTFGISHPIDAATPTEETAPWPNQLPQRRQPMNPARQKRLQILNRCKGQLTLKLSRKLLVRK